MCTLGQPEASIRLMFYDFSSASDTIQPHLLGEKPMKINVDPSLIL